MTRHRRPDDGKYLLKDQQAWWRLVRRARACARNPGRQALTARTRPCAIRSRASWRCWRASAPNSWE
ncbi:MAG: hypothetical protein JF588_19295 [Caulobacterales bacterium]|nr:hypothetical protein [Caulobacterales bacterium]